MGKRTYLACVLVGLLAATGCGDDGGGSTADAQIVVFDDAAIPDAPVPIPDAATPDADLSSAPPAFRVTKIWLRDPHVFAPNGTIVVGCSDVTDSSAVGFSANGQIQEAIDTDGDDADLFLDLSLVAVFDPLNTTDAATGNVTIGSGDCLVSSPRDCTESTTTAAQTTTYLNVGTGSCQMAHANTLSSAGYSPAVEFPSNECFSTGSVTMDFNLAGAQITLESVDVAAVYNGDPNTQSLIKGVIRGFLSEANAANASIPTPIGAFNLATMLPGGSTCPGMHDDRDNLIPGDGKSTLGWWFYLNFEATRLLGYTPASP